MSSYIINNGRVEFIRKKSVDAAKNFPDNYFQYIYIDGAHDYKSVKEDMEAWYPKLQEPGVMGGHDFWMEDVMKAVNDFIYEHNLEAFGSSQLNINKSDIGYSEILNYLDWWLIKYPKEDIEYLKERKENLWKI